MNCIRIGLIALVAAVTASVSNGAQAQSAPTLTQCQLGGKLAGFIAPEMAFSVAPNGKSATVSDIVALRSEGKPVQAKVIRNTKRKLGLSWQVNNVRDARSNAETAVSYRATLNKTSGALSVRASPLGSSQSFSRRGTCRTNSAKETAELTSKIKQASRVVKRQGPMPWSLSAQRRFTCQVPRKGSSLPDWAFTAFTVNHDTRQNVAQVTVSFGKLGATSQSKAKYVDRHRFGYVSYRWETAVVSKQKRKAGERAKVIMEARLRVSKRDGQAELVIDGHKSRHLQTFTLKADCKPG